MLSVLVTALGDSLRSETMTHDAPVVFIVDDDVSVRESLELLVLSSGWRAQTFTSAEEFLDHAPVSAAHCLLLDVNLPDLNGLDLQQLVANERTAMPIIFITGFGDVPMSVKAMKAGAVEFLMKPLNDESLISAIEQALQTSRAALASDSYLKDVRKRYASLSQREQEVMGLVVTGLLNKQVGFELGISEITVKAHRGQAMRKMGAKSLADLVGIAARLGVPRSRKPPA